MNPIKFFAIVFCLALASFGANAQAQPGYLPHFMQEMDFNYLPYWATPVAHPVAQAGLAPALLSSRPVMVRIPIADEAARAYRITDAGGYEYSCGDDEAVPKAKRGFKPITARTFFLETSRTGILPPRVSYTEFIGMPADEQRALLNPRERIAPKNEQYEYVEAKLVYQTIGDDFRIMVTNSKMQMELSYGTSPPEGGKMVAVKYLPDFHTPSQLVKMLVDPWNNYRMDGHAYYKDLHDVFEDITAKQAQY